MKFKPTQFEGKKGGQVKFHLENTLIFHEQLLMEELLKVQFVIIVLWKMKTEEQKSSFIINYKSDGNKERGKVTMLYWPLSLKV